MNTKEVILILLLLFLLFMMICEYYQNRNIIEGHTLNRRTCSGRWFWRTCTPPAPVRHQARNTLSGTHCGVNQFTNNTNGANQICTNHTQCNSNEYETAAPTDTSNRECSTITECEDGFYEIQEPTSTSDRVCQQCVFPSGVTQEFLDSSGQAVTCTNGNDSRIGTCPDGYRKEAGSEGTADICVANVVMDEPVVANEFLNETPSTFEEALMKREELSNAGHNTFMLHPTTINEIERVHNETEGRDPLDINGNEEIRINYYNMIDVFEEHVPDVARLGVRDLYGSTSLNHINSLKARFGYDQDGIFDINETNIIKFIKGEYCSGETTDENPCNDILDAKLKEILELNLSTIMTTYVGTTIEGWFIDVIDPIIKLFIYCISLSERLLEDAEFIFGYIQACNQHIEDNFAQAIQDDIYERPFSYSDFDFGYGPLGDEAESDAYRYLENVEMRHEQIISAFVAFQNINEVRNTIIKVINLADDLAMLHNDAFFMLRGSLKVGMHTMFHLSDSVEELQLYQARREHRLALKNFAEASDEQERINSRSSLISKRNRLRRRRIRKIYKRLDNKLAEMEKFLPDMIDSMTNKGRNALINTRMYQRLQEIKIRRYDNPSWVNRFRTITSVPNYVFGGVLKFGKSVVQVFAKILGSTYIEAAVLAYDIVDFALGGLNPVQAYEIGEGHISDIDIRRQQNCSPPPPHLQEYCNITGLCAYPCPCEYCEDPDPTGCDLAHPEKCDYLTLDQLYEELGELDFFSMDDFDKRMHILHILVFAQIKAGTEIVMGNRGSQCLDLLTNDYKYGIETLEECSALRNEGNYSSVQILIENPVEELDVQSLNPLQRNQIIERRTNIAGQECDDPFNGTINPLMDCSSSDEEIARWVDVGAGNIIYQGAVQAVEYLSQTASCNDSSTLHFDSSCSDEPCDTPGNFTAGANSPGLRTMVRSHICPMAQLQTGDYWDKNGGLDGSLANPQLVDSSGMVSNTYTWKTNDELLYDINNEHGVCSTNFSSDYDNSIHTKQELKNEILDEFLYKNPKSNIDVPLTCYNLKEFGSWEYQKDKFGNSSGENVDIDYVNKCAEKCEENNACHGFFIYTNSEDENEGRCCLKGHINEELLNDETNFEENVNGSYYNFNRSLISTTENLFTRNHSGLWSLGNYTRGSGWSGYRENWRPGATTWTNNDPPNPLASEPMTRELCERDCNEDILCKGYSYRASNNNCLIYKHPLEISGVSTSEPVLNMLENTVDEAYIKMPGSGEENKSFITNNVRLKNAEKAKYCLMARNYIKNYDLDCYRKCCGGDCELISDHSTGYDHNSLCYAHNNRIGGDDNLPMAADCMSFDDKYSPGWGRVHRYSFPDEPFGGRRDNLKFCDNYVGWRNAGEHDGGCSIAAAADTSAGTSNMVSTVLGWLR